MTDQELLRLLLEKEEEGARALCAQYGALAAAVARRILRERHEDVEEVAADAMILVWKKRNDLKADTLRGFLIAAAQHLAVDRWRQLRRRNEVPLLEGDQDETVDMEAGLLNEELQKQILAVSPPDGEIFLRHHLLRESAQEIARRFDMTESAVRSRLHRTRMLLKREVQKDG